MGGGGKLASRNCVFTWCCCCCDCWTRIKQNAASAHTFIMATVAKKTNVSVGGVSFDTVHSVHGANVTVRWVQRSNAAFLVHNAMVAVVCRRVVEQLHETKQQQSCTRKKGQRNENVFVYRFFSIQINFFGEPFFFCVYLILTFGCKKLQE